MKKVLIAIALCTVMSACSKDEPIDNGKHTPTPPNTEMQKVKNEELAKYFDLNQGLTVYQALEKVKATKGAKTVDGRQIHVTAVNEVSRDEQAGSFTVVVAGTVAGKAFNKNVSFDGFAQKPTDEAMAKCVVATWKSNIAFQKDFDFDTLYRLGDLSKFTTAYWSQFVDFTASAPDGSRRYVFTPEDLAQTTISDIRFSASGSRAGTISFVVTYKGIKGNTSSGVNGAPQLSFDKNAYYKHQVSLHTEAVKGFYMRGVYEHIDVFYAGLLQYDHAKFIPRILHKIKNDGDNTISVTLKLLANDGKETELAQFEQTLNGFKPLADLNKDLLLANSTELGKYFGKKFRTTPDGDKLAQMSASPVRAWIEKVQMGVRRDGNHIDLWPEKETRSNGSSIVTVWKPASGSGSTLDLYFENPIFEIVEARKEDIFLNLKLKLTSVNETAVEGVVVPLRVHLIKE